VVSATTQNSVKLSWTASTDNIGVTGYDVYQGTSLVQGNLITTTANIENLSCGKGYSFTVKAKDAARNISSASNIASATTAACVVLVSNVIYDDVTGNDWQDASSGATRNYNNSSPVKVGSRSIRVDVAGNGSLAFQKGTAVNTTSTTQLQFWVYNTSRNGIKVYTLANNGAASTSILLKPASNGWVEILVSMSQLGNPSSIKKVVIQNNSSKSATMYFDQVQLTNTESSTNLATAIKPKKVMNQEAQPASTILEGQVYPNPADGHLIVQLHAPAASLEPLLIIDNSGRVVFRQQVRMEKGANRWIQKLPWLPQGMYYLKIGTGKQAWVQQFIKK
jgi:hypothetical protein